MSQSLVEALLVEQRGRLVASIMGHAERNLFPRMTENEKRAYRNKVLESVGVFYDFCKDALRASAAVSEAEGVVLNEEAMRMLGDLHRAVVKA